MDERKTIKLKDALENQKATFEYHVKITKEMHEYLVMCTHDTFLSRSEIIRSFIREKMQEDKEKVKR